MLSVSRRSFLQAGLAASAAAAVPSVWADIGPTLASAPGTQPLRILILGGTRYLGPAVVRAALARGHHLTLFNRGRTQPSLFPAVERRLGDRFPERGEGLSSLVNGEWDAVIDLNAYYPRLVDASTQLLSGRVGRYVMVSSISVYQEFGVAGLNEAGQVRTLNREFEELPDLHENDWATYGARKAANEAIVRAAFGDRSTILRPCSICGGENNDGSGIYWGARLRRDRRVLLPGDGSDPVQLIDVRDMADFIVLSVERNLEGIYNVLGPEQPLVTRDYIAASARVVGAEAEVVWKGDFPREMFGLPLIAPAHAVPGFSTMSNERAVAAGLRFRALEDTLRSNWIDHRARRGDAFDFAASGVGLSVEKERELLAAS